MDRLGLARFKGQEKSPGPGEEAQREKGSRVARVTLVSEGQGQGLKTKH